MYLATPLNHPSKKLISVSTHQNSTKISYCPPTLRYRHQVHTQEISPPVASGFWQSNHGMNYICHEVAPSLASSSESYSTQSAVSSDDESSHFRPDHRSTRTANVHTPRNTNNQDLKYKITLCKAWEENGECNFGFKCRYAHGENDLRYPRLYGRDHVGLLDKEFYHTRPCFPHVAIGTCPMYERCHAIHDAAVEGPSQQTVRHKEIGEEFFASHLHQHQKATDHYGTPFGSALPVSSSPSQLKNGDHADALCNDDAAYDSLYNRLCNTPQGDSSTTAAFKGKCTISEQHKVEIALAMRGNNPENCCSKYQPTHIAYVTRFGIPCMVKTERVSMS